MFDAREKKLRLVRTWASRHPTWCAWQVTYRCNFRCRFCHYWCDPLGKQPEPTLEQYAVGARKLASYGTLLVSLAGGEPMLRPELPQIVREVGRYHFPFVTTNGWFVTEETARQLMEAGVWGVSVSIDYADADRHDTKRSMDGAWEQAWRAVELLSAARMQKWQRVNVMAVLMDDNIDEMEGLIRLAGRYGACFMVQPYCDLKSGKGEYSPRASVSGRLLELKKKYKNFLSNPLFLSRFDAALDGGVPGCAAGRAFFNIDNYGYVAKCVEALDRPVANILRDAPQSIMASLKDAHRANSCTACWYNCRGEVESIYFPRGFLAALPTILVSSGMN